VIHPERRALDAVVETSVKRARRRGRALSDCWMRDYLESWPRIAPAAKSDVWTFT
jgi:hypothetical protein